MDKRKQVVVDMLKSDLPAAFDWKRFYFYGRPFEIGTGSAGMKDGPPADAQFNFPYSIAFNPIDRTCYVADKYNDAIRKISPQGHVTTVAAKTGTCTDVDIISPSSVAVNSTGDLFVCSGTKILKIAPNGSITQFAKSFSHPFGLAVDFSNDNLYVTDYEDHKICKITPQGEISIVAGTGVAGCQNGPAEKAQFDSPIALCIHPTSGDIYVADFSNSRIRKISQGEVSTIAGTGSHSNIDGKHDVASLTAPFEVALLDIKDNSLLICDNGVVRKISHKGEISTITWLDMGKPYSLYGVTSMAIDYQERVCYLCVHQPGHKVVRMYLP